MKIPLLIVTVWICAPIDIIQASAKNRPNIILIVADDWGWNDVGFHGSNEIPTPNIDALAYNGVILNSHYTMALCTPSRASLLTGNYPIHNGMQHFLLLESAPWGLPLTEKLLPQYLKEYGYSTHAIGKWHLGYYKNEYTPTYRGFDSFYGFYNGYQDYYDHTVQETFGDMTGLDMRRNLDVDNKTIGQYSTDLFAGEAVQRIRNHTGNRPLFLYAAFSAPHTGGLTHPLQAPDGDIAKFSYISDPKRRVYAAMVSKLDESVGKIVTALSQANLLSNSIIAILSDNGALPQGRVHVNHGSNYPLRGFKESYWEGGIRTTAAIWSPLIKRPSRVYTDLMHISDWLPTLCSAAKIPKHTVDGHDQWKAISDDIAGPRTEIPLNIDDIDHYQAFRLNEWKFLNGSVGPGTYEDYYRPARNLTKEYNFGSVLNSDVQIAVNAMITGQRHDGTHDSGPMNFLTTSHIYRLRHTATVKCLNGSQASNGVVTTPCDPKSKPCLYNLKYDPCEVTNVAEQNDPLIQRIVYKINNYRRTAVGSNIKPRDPLADPKLFGGVWSPWGVDEADEAFVNVWIYVLIGLLVIVGVVLFVVAVRKARESNRNRRNFQQGLFLDLMSKKRS